MFSKLEFRGFFEGVLFSVKNFFAKHADGEHSFIHFSNKFPNSTQLDSWLCLNVSQTSLKRLSTVQVKESIILYCLSKRFGT